VADLADRRTAPVCHCKILNESTINMADFVVPSGMPSSVFRNKYARTDADGNVQTWAERVEEVVEGNFSLGVVAGMENPYTGFEETLDLAKRGVLPFSGRHLQHGDKRQAEKPGEIFTNCSTAAFSFVKFWLLMKGSGVGRLYDSDICRVNWDNVPNFRIVIEGPDKDGNGGHPDYEDWMETSAEARHKYDSESETVRWFDVQDSAEGWVKVVEILETAAWQEKHKDKLFIFDFSSVRGRGAAIAGQQNRPASGPVPLMKALESIRSLKGCGMKPWKQAMFVDHFLAACVAVGGVRRSARLAAKSWRERDVIDFIDIKRGGHLYTANNSVVVDNEFWEAAVSPAPSHARRVFEAMTSAAYFDKTGEPAFLNADRMSWNSAGSEDILASNYFGKRARALLNPHARTLEMVASFLSIAKTKRYPFLTNPCGEVLLSVYGGYCTIGDICLANCDSLEDALRAAELLPPFLIRVNSMDFLYAAEVSRTNRIGVGITGIFEFALKFFGYSFFDLIDESKSSDFWEFINSMRERAETSARSFSKQMGMVTPHTVTTVKPSGTISKVMNCTEGAHRPAFGWYIRWVQFHIDDASVAEHSSRGYPVKDISHMYKEHVVVGFPTKLPLADLAGDKLVLVGDATPEQDYEWIRLLETYWLGGHGNNNQVSYTLKYDPEKVDYLQFMDMILANQRHVRACSIMPVEDESAYAYLPEESITKEQYEDLVLNIARLEFEAYDGERLACTSGVCPIELDIPRQQQTVSAAS
jgi:hypothetical protein